MARLIENTHVRHPKTGELAFLAAGGEVPEWAAPLVGGHLVEGGVAVGGKVPSAVEDPQAEAARLRARLADLEAGAAGGGDEPSQDGPPPKGGPGSGAPAWREYAASKQVEVAENASREDVWEALEAAGVPTE